MSSPETLAFYGGSSHVPCTCADKPQEARGQVSCTSQTHAATVTLSPSYLSRLSGRAASEMVDLLDGGTLLALFVVDVPLYLESSRLYLPFSPRALQHYCHSQIGPLARRRWQAATRQRRLSDARAWDCRAGARSVPVTARYLDAEGRTPSDVLRPTVQDDGACRRPLSHEGPRFQTSVPEAGPDRCDQALSRASPVLPWKRAVSSGGTRMPT